MCKESSPASQSKPIMAVETEETVAPVTIGLTELTASLEVLNAKADKKSTVVHHTQASSSPGANKIPGSLDGRNQKKMLPVILAKEVCPPDVAGNRGRSWTICPSRR